MRLQTRRRSTEDGERYRLCEHFDRLMERSGERRSEEATSLPTSVGRDRGRSAWAKRTAQFLGCNYKKVEKIRKIIKDGTPEIQRAVRTNKMRINRAYTLICQMEKGKTTKAQDSTAGNGRAVEILFSEENFTILKELGGDPCVHVNKAMEMYVRSLQDAEDA